MKESPIKAHTRIGNDYRRWMHTAKSLFDASTILRRERERAFKRSHPGPAGLRPGPVPIEIFTIWTGLMLTAFGIECFIKAIWLKQGHQLAQNGKYIPMTKHERHQLVRLCDAARIELNHHEKDTLERISYVAGSIGRYPIARRASQTLGYSWSSADDNVIENLIVRLRTELRKNPRN